MSAFEKISGWNKFTVIIRVRVFEEEIRTSVIGFFCLFRRIHSLLFWSLNNEHLSTKAGLVPLFPLPKESFLGRFNCTFEVLVIFLHSFFPSWFAWSMWSLLIVFFYIACSLTRVRKTQEGFMLHLRYRGCSVVCKQTIIGRGFFTIKS